MSRPVIKPLRHGHHAWSAHRGKGWEEAAEQGTQALGDLPSIESAPPSPMSADRGFFGSRPFSRANDLLSRRSGAPVDRRLP